MAGKKSTSTMHGTKVPERIFAQVSPRSIGGTSLFSPSATIDAGTVTGFSSEQAVRAGAICLLTEAGFEILQVTDATINIAGSLETYHKAFGQELIPEERPVIKARGVEDTATFWGPPGATMFGLVETAPTRFADVVEGVAIEVPRYPMATAAFAPPRGYWHLTLPGDVSLGCNADRAHRRQITGLGAKVAMCDSGWYKHPFFVSRGYRVEPVVLGPGTTAPLNDEMGHGTGESANIFAVAPDATLLPVKISFTNATAGFIAAAALLPHIITCSWGSHRPGPQLYAADQALAAAISAAVATGIVVIFSAGNGSHGFPAQHPEVIAAGGVYMTQSGTTEASDYASGFPSGVYPHRTCPDVCGLVGMKPQAEYIMLPVQPGDDLDADLSGGTWPAGDETTPKDGWAAFSGTSAAAPQLAGVAALLHQVHPHLTPKQVRDIMVRTARDVRTGHCNVSCHPPNGYSAGTGPDIATGAGLVDAAAAVRFAASHAS